MNNIIDLNDSYLDDEKVIEEYEQSKERVKIAMQNLSHAKAEYAEAKEEFNRINKYISQSKYVESTNQFVQSIVTFNREKRINLLTEIWNAITHGLGAILGIVAIVLLLIKAQTPKEYLAYSIYSASIVALFLASTLYHSLIFTKARSVFRVIDHSSIFLLIAGTYTPYLLISLNNQTGNIFFAAIWGLAIAGILLKIFFFEKSKKIGTAIYLIMGWLCVLIMPNMIKSVPLNGIIMLALGGLSYTAGVYFYKHKTLNFAHVYWHLFVLGGAILMFLSIYIYV